MQTHIIYMHTLLFRTFSLLFFLFYFRFNEITFFFAKFVYAFLTIEGANKILSE